MEFLFLKVLAKLTLFRYKCIKVNLLTSVFLYQIMH